ncbi:MAG TPA: glycosyltransferase family 39 protein [Phycisphaerales bacterium]|nr:glycosyltransferase family 39 protein [Phycisphaerales bacterium]
MRIGSGVIWCRRAGGPFGGLALVVICLTVYLPGLASIPPIDRDESRFAQASRQMFESRALPPAEQDDDLHSGGLTIPRVQGRDRLSKPPLIYWLQAAGAAAFTGGDPGRDAIWMYRVPSLVAAMLTVLATWRIGVSMFDPRAAWLGAAMLGVSPVFVWEAHQARADHVMVACTTLAMWGLWSVWHRCGTPRVPGTSSLRHSATPSLLLWIPLALGILTKGPITPLVVGLTAIALSLVSRRWRWLGCTQPIIGMLIVGVIVAPWLLAVARHVGLERYWSVVCEEVFVRAGAAKEGHWGPPGYHVVLLVVLFWPGSLLTGLAVARAFRRGFRVEDRGQTPSRSPLRRMCRTIVSARPARPAECFLLAWIIPAWIVFELSFTKLPHYTMPLYPAIALLAGRAVLAAASGSLVLPRSQRLGTSLWLGLSALVAIGIPAGLFTLGVRHSAWIYLLGVPWVASVLAFAYFARRAFAPERVLATQLAGVFLAVAFWAFTLHAMLPGTKRLFLTELLAERIAEIDPGGARPIASVGYHEDSLVFRTRAAVLLIDEQQQGEFWRTHPDGLLIVPKERILRSHSVLAEVEGFNYSRGRRQSLAIVRPFWLGIERDGGQP